MVNRACVMAVLAVPVVRAVQAGTSVTAAPGAMAVQVVLGGRGLVLLAAQAARGATVARAEQGIPHWALAGPAVTPAPVAPVATPTATGTLAVPAETVAPAVPVVTASTAVMAVAQARVVPAAPAPTAILGTMPVVLVASAVTRAR
jgi:hypothetical protein